MPEKETTLPLELWRVILTHLSVLDLCRCSQVCQEWRELVKSLDSTRWKELFLSSKRWKHPNWPNYTQKEPSSWKDTYKIHHIASKQWVNRSIEVRCAPCLYLFRRRLERQRSLKVGLGKEFTSIKSALAFASPFDCILVYPGVYEEQHVLSLKFPIEICGKGDLGDVILRIPIEQQATTARIQNIVLQPGAQRSQSSLPVILKVGTGHVQLDNCIIEQGHIQVSSPGSIVVRYCTFSNAFLTLRSVGFSRIENCQFSSEDSSAVIVEGLPPITRQRPISRPVEDWMNFNGIVSLGLEDLYDLSVIEEDSGAKNGGKNICCKGVDAQNDNKVSSKMRDLGPKDSCTSQVTVLTSDLNHSMSRVTSDQVCAPKRRYHLDTQCREVVRSIHGCIIRNNCFCLGKGAVLVRRRGHAWIEGNEIHHLSHGIRCLTGAKVVILNNRIHDCQTSGLFFRERSTGLVAGNRIFSNKEAGADIRSGSDPILQHNQIHSGRRSGVVILDRGRGVIKDNDIYDNKEAGVYILYRGNPVVRRNRIWAGRAAGVAVTEEGRGHILYNDICGMEWGGVDIRNGGNPVVSNNWIREGHADGIVIGEGGKGVIMDNDIRGNSGCGVWVLTVAKPLIYGNRIADSGDSGVAFVSNSDLHHDNQQLSSQFAQPEQEEQQLQPLFFDEDLSSSANFEDDTTLDLNGPRPDKNYASVDNNAIFDNAGHGVHFSGSEGLLIRGNNIHNNEGCGISVAKPAEIAIQDNSVCRNNGSGVCVEMSCSANVSGNGFYGNRKHGILVSGKGLIKENDVFCNALSGIELRGPGDPYVTRNRIQSTDHYGVNILENARGYLDNNDIYQCIVPSLFKHPDSTVAVINNRIIPVSTNSGREVCVFNEDTKECRHDPTGLNLDSPPRPLLPNKENKFPRPPVSRLSMSSSRNGHVVGGMTTCHGRSRFCVVL